MARTEIRGGQILDSSVDLAVDVTGILPVTNGGTGSSSLTANYVLLGNGTGALQTVAPGTNGNVLKSNGTTWSSTALGHSALTGLSADDHTQYVLLAGRSGGQTLKPDSASTTGVLSMDGKIKLLASDQTLTSATAANAIDASNTYTLDFASANLGSFVRFFATVILKQSGNVLGLASLFNHQATYKNDPTVAANTGPIFTLVANHTITADSQSITSSIIRDMLSQPTFTIASGGVLTVTEHTAFRIGGVVNTGATVTTKRGVHVTTPTGSGVITTHVGIDIDAMTKGTTSAIGIRIAAPTIGTSRYAIQLSDTGGTAAGGITFGSDVNQYRLAADKLATDDNIVMTTVGMGLYIKEGTNARMGVATLVAGTVTVSNTSVTANTRIFLTIQSLGTVTVPKAIGVTARTAATSFTITSADATDTSVIAWQLIEPS